MKPSPTVMPTTYETLCINLTWLCDTTYNLPFVW